MLQKRKVYKYSAKRFASSPILQVSQVNSGQFQTKEKTTTPLQVFSYIELKRKCYAFQLLKQFILFPQSENSSFQKDKQHVNKKKRKLSMVTAQLAFMTISSIFRRSQQKMLLSAYDKMKKQHFKKKMVYRNKEYVQKIVKCMYNLIKEQHKEILQFVFLELMNNLRLFRFKEIMQANRNSFVPQKVQFDERLFKTLQHSQFYNFNQSDIQKHDTEPFFQADSRIQIAKDFGWRKQRYDSLQTTHKQPIFSEYIKRTKQKTKITEDQIKEQLIYIVDTIKKRGSSIKKQPTKHIQIPIESANVNIIRIQGQKDSNRQEKILKENQNFHENKEFDCLSCEFCKKLKLKKEIMRKIRNFS